jgi:hypothetical protein
VKSFVVALRRRGPADDDCCVRSNERGDVLSPDALKSLLEPIQLRAGDAASLKHLFDDGESTRVCSFCVQFCLKGAFVMLDVCEKGGKEWTERVRLKRPLHRDELDELYGHVVRYGVLFVSWASCHVQTLTVQNGRSVVARA